MPIEPFPERVFPRKLCHRKGEISEINSTIPLSKLLRLREYLHDTHGQAEICLSFDRDETGHCHVRGTVSADVNLLCQRCLEATAFSLASAMDIKVTESDEEAEDVAQTSADPMDRLEIVVCDEGQLDLLSLVEDELIMSLPIVASHNNDQCNETLNALHQTTESLDKTASSNIQGLEKLEALKAALQQDARKSKLNKSQDKLGNKQDK